MIHDYLYIKYKVSVNFKYKWYADLIYAKEMELMGASAYSTWSRFIGLTIFGGLFFTPIMYFSGNRMSRDKRVVLKLYTFLSHN
jgi:hypothetical protein